MAVIDSLWFERVAGSPDDPFESCGKKLELAVFPCGAAVRLVSQLDCVDSLSVDKALYRSDPWMINNRQDQIRPDGLLMNVLWRA